MDTREVAAYLGTEPKILRRFLRDPRSTFCAVGSGSRYTFKESDMPELQRRFEDWQGAKVARPVIPRIVDTAERQRERDQAVWDEEGEVVIPDIRNPRVRREVKARAAQWERNLELRLMAAGLHLSQHAAKLAAV